VTPGSRRRNRTNSWTHLLNVRPHLIAQRIFHRAARLPVDFVKALLNHTDKGVTGIYARWHTFEEKREAVMAIEAAVLPLMPKANALAAWAPA
jgi:integrase